MEAPPAELMLRVVGTDDADAFRSSGFMHVDELGEILARHGYAWDDFRDIYDFGAGCGRLTLALRERAPQARLAASDIDAEAIGWLGEHLPNADIHTNPWLPPLSFVDGAFDLVVAFSVFTHLPEQYQDRWLRELRRVTRPGAVLLVTVHGNAHWRQTWDVNFAEHPQRDQIIAPLATKRERDGLAHWRGDGWERIFPDYYHTSWHTPGYVRRHWSRWFEVLDVHETDLPGEHDVVALRRGEGEERRGLLDRVRDALGR